MSTTSRKAIRAGLVVSLDAKVVDELLDAYEEAKSNYYLGGLRLSAVEGGRFCEAAFRLLEQRAFGRFLPLGRQLNTDNLIGRLAGVVPAIQPPAVRLHIPRALRVVYDIRNNRDAAHLGDNIDPNLQDATLVIGVLDWVLAEFVRLHHNVPPNEAQQMVEDLVTRQAPVIQDFSGFLKVLRPDLTVGPRCAVLLYQRGKAGATFDEMSAWVKPKMRPNLRRSLTGLADDKAWIHQEGDHYTITNAGQKIAEKSGWLDPV